MELKVGLPVGKMVKKSDLPLVDAMNSIELFNPKMDTGMNASSSSSSTIPETGVEGSHKLFDPAYPFTPEEILWIMDEMLSAEVSQDHSTIIDHQIAWYRGVNLAQSVFRCLYYYHPDKLSQADIPDFIKVVFRTYLVAYCKCIDLAYREFTKGHVNDVEDIWMDHFGIAVYLDDTVEDVDRQLEEAILFTEEFGREFFDRVT